MRAALSHEHETPAAFHVRIPLLREYERACPHDERPGGALAEALRQAIPVLDALAKETQA